MNKVKKTPRRLLTAAMASVLMITLSSCSGATNTYGSLDSEAVYATAGEGEKKFTVTNGELWDELKWSSNSVLTSSIEEVIINKQVKNITNVMNKKFADLSDDDKTNLSITEESEFTELNKKYKERLLELVIADIYNYNFSNTGYKTHIKESLRDLKTDMIKSQEVYADEIYAEYQISKIGNENLKDLVAAVPNKIEDNYLNEEAQENFLKIANDETLRSIYYVTLAKELFATAKLTDEVKEADENDDDTEDDKEGYFTRDTYVNKFKSEYTNTYDLDAIIIKFSTQEEFDNTLRAFGIKVYNNNLYFIKGEDGSSYDEYIKYYDDFSNARLGVKEYNSDIIDANTALEVYAQIYNYMYGGYREPLVTGNTTINAAKEDLNNLRGITEQIIDIYGTNGNDKYNSAITNLKANYSTAVNDTKTLYTSKELKDIDSSFKTYLYETLDSEKASSRYSTSTQSANDNYYIAYKFAEEKISDTVEDHETLQKYEDYYNKDLSTYEIMEYIKADEKLFKNLENLLIKNDTTENYISSAISEAKDDVKVKIYNEALEIVYSNANSSYSKTLGSPSNKNLLATIKYDGTTYNLNIKADENDSDTLYFPGTSNPKGAFDILEKQDGATTAIDIISKKIIKTTKAYEKTAEKKKDYEDYLTSLLYNFANDGLSSNGYPSSIGKYNFLMQYFHSANVNDIVNNYYRVQIASTSLLTDYTKDELIKLFGDYSSKLYDDFFEITSTRLVVYFDGDDDGYADDVEDWKNIVINDSTSEFDGETFEYAAKHLVYTIYNKLAASTKAHTDYLTTLVSEINDTAKAVYVSNPIAAENIWAKYRHLGLCVKTEEISAKNTVTSIDFNLKERLYNYSKGTGDIVDDNGNVIDTVNYQYFINETTPTCYIEPLDDALAINTNNNYIVESNDGYNLLLVTAGTTKASAEFKESDNQEGLLNNIVVKYNDNYVTIPNVFNNDKKLNDNQIKLYILDSYVNGSSTLAPATLSSAYESFLSPIYTRYSSSETQRIILLSFIRTKTGKNSSTSLFDVITYANESYNGVDGSFAKIIKINERSADSYNDIYDDPTETLYQYKNWWDDIEQIVDKLLVKEGE